MKRPAQPDNCEPIVINSKVASRSSWIASAIFWSVTQINHVNRARVLIGWKSTKHVCQLFTRHIQVYRHEKVGEKVGRIETSSICRQQFANAFTDCFCAVHTHQLDFANTSLPTLVCRVKAALLNLAILLSGFHTFSDIAVGRKCLHIT